GEKDASLSKYEFGVGLTHVNYPKYPGSNENESVTLPIPLFYYRGDIVRSDEDGGVRGRFFNNDHFEINLSLGGAAPASSKKIKAREGMPSLPFILEIGPGLIYKMIPSSDKHPFSLSLNIPVRVPIAFNDTKLDDRGLVFNPILFGYYNIIPKKFQTFYFATYRWGNREYNETYYQVDPRFATSSRNQYQAKAGTVATTLGLGFVYEIIKDWSFVTVASFENLKSNANKQSPLFKKDNQTLLVFALSWTFFKSDEKQKAY
ncbi:MipA/OmpV family protein, partial [Bacteriovoracaceae bacterium]|nr:MipA/OmpV family protein [Bacteriovoracaceae bacterium]